MIAKHPVSVADDGDEFVREIEDCTTMRTSYCTTCIRTVSDPCVSADDSSDWFAWRIHVDKYCIGTAMCHCAHADDSVDHQAQQNSLNTENICVVSPENKKNTIV